MFLKFFSTKRSNLFTRSFHVGKSFKVSNPEDIFFHSICINLRQRKWTVLDKLLSSNLTNSLVNRVVSEFQMSPDLALGFYNKVEEQRDFSPSLECVCVLIHVMIRCKRYDDGLDLIGKLIREMGYSHLEVLDGLWDSYNAEISCPNVFDALVRGCTLLGDANCAYDVIVKLRMEKGFSVSVHAWNNFFSCLIKSDEVSCFWRKYGEMISYGHAENVYTFNLVIHALCKEMLVSEAIGVFYRMLKGGIYPNVVTFNIEPNVRTYATLIDGYLRKGCTKEAFRLCSHMVDNGLIPNVVIYNSMIHWLCFEGDTTTASILLSYMIKTNICFDKFTNSVLVKGLSRNGYLNEALDYHKWLVAKNLVDKDRFLENILVYYLFRSDNEPMVKEVLDDMCGRGLSADTVTYGTMIDAFSKQGSISYAVRVYDDMIKMGKKPNLVIYNSIVDGLSRNLSVDIAQIMVDELKKIGLLDIVTLNSLLNAYCTNWKVKEALTLFLQMQDGKLVNRVTYNILMNFVCKFASIQEAKELMEMMVAQSVAPDSVTYTILLMNACKKSSTEEVVDIHDDMVVKGVIPNSQTYDAIVSPLLG